MTERVWHKGPPPHIGWWNASAFQDPSCWRWWDGNIWSIDAPDFISSRFAASCAKEPATQGIQGVIEWTNYWPKGARVPRIKP